MSGAAELDGPGAIARALDDPSRPPPGAIGAAQARRFDVHRNNAAVGMVEALRASFPVVERLVGAEFFAALARAYIAAAPPDSPVLFRYGGGFGAFIDGFPPARPVPYLGDVARLEWLRLAAYHAADADPIGLAALAALPPRDLERARLAMHPSLGLLGSRWPVVSILAASAGEGDPAAVDLARGEDAAVIRPALAVETRLLPGGAHDFLAALAAGRPLGAAAGAAAAAHPGFELAEHLEVVFSMGAVVGIAAPGAPEPDGTVT